MKNNRSGWKEENILISLALESAQLGIRQVFLTTLSLDKLKTLYKLNKPFL